MLLLFGYEANGTPYSIVLWPLIRIFGDGATLLRLPAVLGGTASVPALWWAARRFSAPAAALPAPGCWRSARWPSCTGRTRAPMRS